MATYKRRIVYLADEEWEWLSERAAAEGITISSLIRKRAMPKGPAEPIDMTAVRMVPSPEEVGRITARLTDRYDTQPVRAVPKVKR